MKKELICIECPKGCTMAVDVENGKAARVSGNMCPKGAEYAAAEIEDPRRILTATVLCEGLDIRMLPVRTDTPISKTVIMQAMDAVRKIRVDRPVRAGDVIADDFFNARLIATRTTKYQDALAI